MDSTQSPSTALHLSLQDYRESGPLADCLDKLINEDDLLRDPCADLIKDAETLLEDIREKEVREGACAYSHRHKTLARHVHIRIHSHKH